MRVSTLLFIALIAPAAADDVYKTVDAQGHVTYSDKPLSPQSQRVSVDVIAANPEDAARLAKAQAVANVEAAQEAKQAQQQAIDQQKQASQEAARKRSCDAARNRYAVFAAGGRIFRTDDQGNRAYYSDAEIDAQRISSKAAMDRACSQ
jgi:photosystem II stability/assembly factor-like uncharacterized protein